MKRGIKTLLERIFSKKILFSRRGHAGRKVAVTFDDGPHPGNTERLLSILKKNGIRATFFLSGDAIAEYPHLAKRIAEEGHVVGNHAYFHKRMGEIGFRNYLNGIGVTDMLLSEADKRRHMLFRPPYGELDLRLVLYALIKGKRIVGWTFDSADSDKRSSRELKEHLESADIEGGEVILFHEDYAHTIDAMPAIIDSLRSRGFDFCTIDEMFGGVAA